MLLDLIKSLVYPNMQQMKTKIMLPAKMPQVNIDTQMLEAKAVAK